MFKKILNYRQILVFVILILIYCGGGGSSMGEIKIQEEEGTLMGGSMAFDGIYFWAMSIDKGFKSTAGKKINKIDKSGKIVSSFNPKENISGDIAFDGENLWTGYAFGWETGRMYSDHGAIYLIDPETERLTNKFTIPEYFDDLEGLAANSSTLWVMVMKRDEEDKRVEYIYEIDLESESIESIIKLDEFLDCTGMSYLDGHLWVLGGFFHKKVFKVEPGSGEIIEEYDFEMRIINGIVSTGKEIYLFDEEMDILFGLQ